MNWSDEVEVFNEDCMITMSRYPDNYFDLAIVDPPYGLDDWNERGSNKKYMDKKHMDLEKVKGWESKPPTEDYFKELQRVSKNQIIWGGNHFLDYLGSTKEMIIWDKKLRGMHFSDCEIAWSSGVKAACRIFSLSANQLQRIHPTQKPIPLYLWLYKKYTKKGFKILDTHFGSGSHGIALDSANKIEKMELTLVASEIDKDYYLDAKKRFEKETAWQSIF